MINNFKPFILLLVVIYISISLYILDKIFILPVKDYNLFESGMVNILYNYIFLLCLFGMSITLVNLKKISLYMLLLVFFIVTYLITLILFNIILNLVFVFNLDAYFGFDKFPLIIIYLLSTFIGIILWFHPINYFCKIILVIIFGFITSFHIGLKDIEAFSVSSLINFPGGNLLIIIWLSILIIYLLKFINKKYTIIISKIYGSWLITIGIMSLLFSKLY